jgi:hypothetical protein
MTFLAQFNYFLYPLFDHFIWIGLEFFSGIMVFFLSIWQRTNVANYSHASRKVFFLGVFLGQLSLYFQMLGGVIICIDAYESINEFYFIHNYVPHTLLITFTFAIAMSKVAVYLTYNKVVQPIQIDA